MFPECRYLDKLGIERQSVVFVLNRVCPWKCSLSAWQKTSLTPAYDDLDLVLSCATKALWVAISLVTSVPPVMLDCLKVTWCTNQILLWLDLYLLNPSTRQPSHVVIRMHLPTDYLEKHWKHSHDLRSICCSYIHGKSAEFTTMKSTIGVTFFVIFLMGLYWIFWISSHNVHIHILNQHSTALAFTHTTGLRSVCDECWVQWRLNRKLTHADTHTLCACCCSPVYA